MKVLLIDDDEALASVYATGLNKEGIIVTVAPNGQDGLSKLKAGEFDLVLLDQVLPDISGTEVLKEIKNTQGIKDIPVMILSNFGQEELVKQAINMGAVEYIFKYQVEIGDVVKKIKEVLDKGK
ncbi:MAG TPA: response regulator transcription factor [Patescibacteria group bacterium]|nr:response regulator transcription factor [Patescibacteria group bacterium]